MRQQRDGVAVDADDEAQPVGQLERLALDGEGAVGGDDLLAQAVARSDSERELEQRGWIGSSPRMRPASDRED
jgi:hypothetical protein